MIVSLSCVGTTRSASSLSSTSDIITHGLLFSIVADETPKFSFSIFFFC